METGLTTLQETARKAGITLDKARHWLSSLGVETVKVGRVRHVRDADVPTLEKMARLVEGGLSPVEAVATIKAGGRLPPEVARHPAATEPSVAPHLEEIGRALVALAESQRVAAATSEIHGREVAALREMVARLVEENRALRSEVAGVRLALMPPADPPRPVTAWQPEARPDPLAGASWFRRVWVEITAPERLRRFDS